MICSPPGLAGPCAFSGCPSRSVAVVAVDDGWTGSPVFATATNGAIADRQARPDR
jgi:hypothetical protein